MKVKICGITRKEDVKTCERNGAELMGFINIQRSKRFVDVDKIHSLISTMQDKSRAVVVTETEDLVEVESLLESTGIQYVQFHSQSATELKRFKENNPQVKVIRAVGIPESMAGEKVEEIKDYADVCDYLLFDYEVAGKSGGTGKQIPLDLAVKAAEAARKNPQIGLFLAGGMDSHRMKSEGKILEDVFDYVDVNSGVENQPGEKDENKIIGFMKVIDNS
ncbi:MAG: phosphoribosylanthranilate isomerase [Methanobacterium sp.]